MELSEMNVNTDSEPRNENRGGYLIVIDPVEKPVTDSRQCTMTHGETGFHDQSDKDVPPKIYEMIRMYEYGNSSLLQKCRNFYRQGKFMEKYEDDAPWDGEFSRYFPTYHDLNIRQLRGYFTWRTNVRKGIYRPTTTSLAYIYLYELMNGIGTSTPEESLWKMQEFETEYLDSEIGDERMRLNLRRWIMELAIINQLPQKTVLQYIEPYYILLDRSLVILREPYNRTDEEVFQALSHLVERKIENSPVLLLDKTAGKHFFAEVWRIASTQFRQEGNDLFTACFGSLKRYHWYPLANAVYLERRKLDDIFYELNSCHRYLFHDGYWQEEKYDELYFDRKRVRSLLHITDLKFRRYLKTGHYLRENPEEAWAIPYVEAVIEADRQAKIEAARPKVHINLENLVQIRKDAVITRDSLLTEEDFAEANTRPAVVEKTVVEAVAENNKYDNASVKLDPLYRQILRNLLDGGTADDLLRTHRLMPVVVTDTINEAFFDEIGDSILDCEGDRLSLVEDYVEDVRLLLTH